MDVLTQFFDHYVINARLKPAFFALLPLVLTIFAWFPELQSIMGGIMTILITCGVLSFMSGWISNKGNLLQEKLFIKWGGASSTTLLRFSDNTLDCHTKQRYHHRLEAIIPALSLPNSEQEKAAPDSADQLYTSAINFLREMTRDKKKYPMVYSDNVGYGFARNLLAIKWFGVSMSFLAFMANLFLMYLMLKPGFFRIEYFSFKVFLLSFIVAVASFITMAVFILLINEIYVKMRAVRYAKSLLAACEACVISENLKKA